MVRMRRYSANYEICMKVFLVEGGHVKAEGGRKRGCSWECGGGSGQRLLNGVSALYVSND